MGGVPFYGIKQPSQIETHVYLAVSRPPLLMADADSTSVISSHGAQRTVQLLHDTFNMSQLQH